MLMTKIGCSLRAVIVDIFDLLDDATKDRLTLCFVIDLIVLIVAIVGLWQSGELFRKSVSSSDGAVLQTVLCVLDRILINIGASSTSRVLTGTPTRVPRLLGLVRLVGLVGVFAGVQRRVFLEERVAALDLSEKGG